MINSGMSDFEKAHAESKAKEVGQRALAVHLL